MQLLDTVVQIDPNQPQRIVAILDKRHITRYDRYRAQTERQIMIFIATPIADIYLVDIEKAVTIADFSDVPFVKTSFTIKAFLLP